MPSSAGARRAGQELAPAALRRAGLGGMLAERGVRPRDHGDLPQRRHVPDHGNPACQNERRVLEMAKSVADATERVLHAGPRILVLGGDCTITLGVLAGLKRIDPEPGLFYLDGDLDLNIPGESTSGILDGMVLAHVAGFVDNELAAIAGPPPLVPGANIVAFGFNVEAGWIDPPELPRFEQSAMAGFPRAALRGPLLDDAISTAIRRLEAGEGSFLVHFDVDVLDRVEFPAVDVPHDGGLGMPEAAMVLRSLWDRPRCAGLVVTEFNAALDPDGSHAARLAGLLADVLGAKPAPHD